SQRGTSPECPDSAAAPSSSYSAMVSCRVRPRRLSGFCCRTPCKTSRKGGFDMMTFLAAVAVSVLWVVAVSVLFGTIAALILRRREQRDEELEDWFSRLANDERDGDASR